MDDLTRCCDNTSTTRSAPAQPSRKLFQSISEQKGTRAGPLKLPQDIPEPTNRMNHWFPTATYCGRLLI